MVYWDFLFVQIPNHPSRERGPLWLVAWVLPQPIGIWMEMLRVGRNSNSADNINVTRILSSNLPSWRSFLSRIAFTLLNCNCHWHGLNKMRALQADCWVLIGGRQVGATLVFRWVCCGQPAISPLEQGHVLHFSCSSTTNAASACTHL